MTATDSNQPRPECTDTIYQIPVVDASGHTINLSSWQGKILLIVNVASRCGFTPQYQSLQHLQQKFQAAGFSVLAFPCNQFMHQEPESLPEIQQFCSTNYQTTFPLYNKVNVNGKNAAPIYKFLKRKLQKKPWINFVPWNFTKFLINTNGDIMQRYSPLVSMKKIEEDIAQLLTEKTKKQA